MAQGRSDKRALRTRSCPSIRSSIKALVAGSPLQLVLRALRTWPKSLAEQAFRKLVSIHDRQQTLETLSAGNGYARRYGPWRSEQWIRFGKLCD